MERASRLIGKMKFPGGGADPDSLAGAAWRAAVGPRIARYAQAERLVGSRLIVGVEDAVWQQQLGAMRSLILGKLREVMTVPHISQIEFRIAPPRIGPGAAAHSAGPLFGESKLDEADSIADPGLRRLYVAARKRDIA